MAGRTEHRASSGDETAATSTDAGAASQNARQAANESSPGETSNDGSSAPGSERHPKRLTSAEMESLLESSVDGPQSLSEADSSSADLSLSEAANTSLSPVPNQLILDQAYSLEDVINV